jgi:hypothetical protein
MKDFCEAVVQDFVKQNRRRPRKKSVVAAPTEMVEEVVNTEQPRSILKNGPIASA